MGSFSLPQPSDTFLSAQLWLVAVDVSGNAQDDATLVPLKTLPDTSPPALLAGSGADDVGPLRICPKQTAFSCTLGHHLVFLDSLT